MSLSINSNANALFTNQQLNTNSQTLSNSLNTLASGSSLNSAADGASELSITDKLLAQISGLGQAIQNSNESIGMLQIADGGLGAIDDNMQRVRTLTLQASNDTLNDSNRAAIQKEIDSLMQSSTQISNSTSYNGTQLLNGSSSALNTQIGANSGESQSVEIGSISSLLSTIDVTTQEGREAALQSTDEALQSIGNIRSDIGASQNALVANIRNASQTQINTAAAESQISGVDFAQESANFSKANMLSQIGSFAQAQANVSSSSLAGLLG